MIVIRSNELIIMGKMLIKTAFTKSLELFPQQMLVKSTRVQSFIFIFLQKEMVYTVVFDLELMKGMFYLICVMNLYFLKLKV